MTVTFVFLSGVSGFTRTKLQCTVHPAGESTRKTFPDVAPWWHLTSKALRREKTQEFGVGTEIKNYINFRG